MAGSNFSIVNGIDGVTKVPIATPANDINGNTVVGHLAMTPVAGIATAVSATNPLPVSDPALGGSSDTPWAGGGGSSVIAALKAIYLKLAATLTVSLSGALPAGTNAIGSVSISNLPIAQPITAAALPLPTGAATAARQPAIGSAGSPATDILSVQGAPSMTALKIDGSAVTQPVTAAALPLPTGAATAARQPAIGSAGSPATDVMSVQGAPSMTALKIDGSAVTQPVTAAALPLPTGAATAARQPAIGSAGSPAPDVMSVQGAPSMTALKIDGSAVTQPVSAAALPLPTGAATAARQPAIGSAGSPATDVMSVQGAPSMTALKIDGSAVTQPVSGIVALAIAPLSWRVSAAAEASRVLKASAGTLYSVYVTTPSAGYLMLFDATTVPIDGAVAPVDVVQCASSATTVLDYTATPLSFNTGIVAVFSSTGPFTKTASPVAFFKGGVL